MDETYKQSNICQEFESILMNEYLITYFYPHPSDGMAQSDTAVGELPFIIIIIFHSVICCDRVGCVVSHSDGVYE